MTATILTDILPNNTASLPDVQSRRHNSRMHINARNDFAASPQETFAMLTDPDFQRTLAEKADSSSHSASVTGSTTVLTQALPIPAQFQKFVGSDITMTQTTVWSAAGPDGSRTGLMTVEIHGAPVTCKLNATLAPGGRGTIVSYVGTFTINVPIFGKHLEKETEPAVLGAIDIQQAAGEEYLSSR